MEKMHVGRITGKSMIFILHMLIFFLFGCACALVPVNIFIRYMPEWISLILSGSIVIINSLIAIMVRKKSVIKRIMYVIGGMGIIISLFGTYCNPYWNSIWFDSGKEYAMRYNAVLTFEQAERDIDFAYKYLKKVHPALYGPVPREIRGKYNKAVNRLKSAERIDVSMLAGEIGGIFSLLKDDYTEVVLNYNTFRYMQYVDEENRKGNIMTGINSMTIEETLKKYSGRISYGTDVCGIRKLGKYLSTIEGLSYLGVNMENGVTYEYEDSVYHKRQIHVSGKDFTEWEQYAQNSGINPLNEETNCISYEIDEDRSLAFLRITSFDGSGIYESQLNRLFMQISILGIRNLAIDLRDNVGEGGNNDDINELFKYINVGIYKKRAADMRFGSFIIRTGGHSVTNRKSEAGVFAGNIYVLTSKITFGIAADMAQYIQDNDLGLIIGEMPYDNPNGYGNTIDFILPESGLKIKISNAKRYRIDKKKEMIVPDIPCGRDEAEEELYSQIPGGRLRGMISEWRLK